MQLYYYLRKFDKAELDSLEVSTEELDAAFEQVEPEFLEVLKKAAGNIRRFHEKQVRNSFIINDIDGVLMGQKIMPIEKVGFMCRAARRPTLRPCLWTAYPPR